MKLGRLAPAHVGTEQVFRLKPCCALLRRRLRAWCVPSQLARLLLPLLALQALVPVRPSRLPPCPHSRASTMLPPLPLVPTRYACAGWVRRMHSQPKHRLDLTFLSTIRSSPPTRSRHLVVQIPTSYFFFSFFYTLIQEGVFSQLDTFERRHNGSGADDVRIFSSIQIK